MLSVLLLVLQSSAFAASLRDDQGLLPPASTDRSPRVARIRTCLAFPDLSCAQQQAEETIEAEPKNFEGYFWRGVVCLRQNEGYDAVRFFRRAEGYDANGYVLRLLAISYYRVRQFRLFVLKMNEAIANQPDDYVSYYYLGRYYLDEITDFNKAADKFREAIQLNPKDFQSHYYLGYCAELQREVKEAEAHYQASMELSEAAGAKFAEPYQGMARLRLLENRPAEALSLATRAVDLAPSDAASHQVLAKTYTVLGRQAEAIGEWEQTARWDPTFALPYYQLYRIYLTIGDQGKANSAYAQFKKLSSIY